MLIFNDQALVDIPLTLGRAAHSGTASHFQIGNTRAQYARGYMGGVDSIELIHDVI